MNIILVGFMGCGKSTLGIRLSYRMRQVFTDTDKAIEANSGREISEIFATDGEAAFRDMETALLERYIADRIKNQIISTGGGMPVRPQNRDLLKKLGVVVWLRIKPETVYDRLKGDTTRPLLQGDDPLGRIHELMSARESAYMDCADVYVDVDDKTIERIMDEVFTKAAGVWKKRKKELYR